MEDFSKYNGEETTLRKAQLRMLDILIEVDKICRKHNIQYWLDFGTLLGAVRHGGFIPWDDDLDITVMRKDYKKLRKILKEELPDNLVFQDHTTDKYYPLKFAKVRDKNSKIEESIGEEEKTQEKGIYIDIFFIEKGNIKVKNFVDYFHGRAFRRLQHYGNKKMDYFIASLIWIPSCLVVYFFRLFNFIFPSEQMIYGFGVATPGKYQLKKSNIFPIREIEFEGRRFMCVNDTNAYLTELYGSYTQIPDEKKRKRHFNKVVFYN
jgi:lipopolysaccharide cholinephosphotransferase